jgi:uncharacterized membrane protein YphA (DoxX/SURF4 family)
MSARLPFATLSFDALQCIGGGGGLRRLFSTFPAGWPGFGLLLLRLAVASISLAQGADYLTGSGVPASGGAWLIGALTFVIGVSLMIGFLTPIVSIAAAFASVGFALNTSPSVPNSLFARLGIIDAIVIAMALAVLGAGAFSLDAVLFGRREIIIPDISRSSK